MNADRRRGIIGVLRSKSRQILMGRGIVRKACKGAVVYTVILSDASGMGQPPTQTRSSRKESAGDHVKIT